MMTTIGKTIRFYALSLLLGHILFWITALITTYGREGLEANPSMFVIVIFFSVLFSFPLLAPILIYYLCMLWLNPPLGLRIILGPLLGAGLSYLLVAMLARYSLSQHDILFVFGPFTAGAILSGLYCEGKAYWKNLLIKAQSAKQKSDSL